MELAKRKHPRLKDYDYSQNGCYFVTVCVKSGQNLLGHIPAAQNADTGPTAVGRGVHTPPPDVLHRPAIVLTPIGAITEKYIQNIPRVYSCVRLEHYAVMPNHVHLLIAIMDYGDQGHGGVWSPRPSLDTIVRSFKTMVSKEAGESIWQTSFYDRVIRDERDYQEIWQYIEGNPARWQEDELYEPRWR